MPTFADALRRFNNPQLQPPALGGRPHRGSERDVLAADLLDVSRTNRIYFILCFAAVWVVFIGAAAIAVRYLDSPDRIRTIFSVLGISITALFGQMTSLWKQKVKADMLLVLARQIPEAELKSIVDALLRDL
jgi:hypothetical protein